MMNKLKVVAGIGMIVVGSILSIPQNNLLVLHMFIPNCQIDSTQPFTSHECSGNYSNWLLFRLISLCIAVIGIPILIFGLREKSLAPFSRK